MKAKMRLRLGGYGWGQREEGKKRKNGSPEGNRKRMNDGKVKEELKIVRKFAVLKKKSEKSRAGTTSSPFWLLCLLCP